MLTLYTRATNPGPDALLSCSSWLVKEKSLASPAPATHHRYPTSPPTCPLGCVPHEFPPFGLINAFFIFVFLKAQ